MLESAPFSPLVYWPHVVLGIGSAIAVLVAVLAPKGSRLHRRSGLLFAFAMGVAALTAISFSFVRFAPNALFSSVTVLYGIGAGVLALRARKRIWRGMEFALAAIPLGAVLFATAMVIGAILTSPEPLPPLLFIMSGLVILIFGYFFRTDVRYLRANSLTPFQ